MTKIDFNVGKNMLVNEETEQTEKVVDGLASAINAIISGYIANYVYPNDKGWLFGAKTDFQLPGFAEIVQPSLAFISFEHLKVLEDETVTIVPDLVVEVASKNDTYYDLENKVVNYLKAGVKMVWLVRPISQIVEVHQIGKLIKGLVGDDELDGGDVLPGFKLKVSDIFKRFPSIFEVATE